MDYVHVDGADLQAMYKDNKSGPGLGFGPKFSPSDFTELSRRSGISVDDFKVAWGSIYLHRLSGGLLQRKVFSRSIGMHEYLTIVPLGDWRVVHYGGKRAIGSGL